MDRYGFSHERLRRAARQMLSDDEAERTHLRIARILMAATVDDTVDGALFQICDHFERSDRLLFEQHDVIQLAQYFLSAGQRAMASAAYETALNHLHVAQRLVGNAAWDDQYDVGFALYLSLAVCLFQTGSAARAEAIADELLERARTNEDQLKVYLLVVNLYTGLGRFENALEAGSRAAELLGFQIPTTARKLNAFKELVRALFLWRTRDLMHLPQMEDSRYLATMDLLMELTASAFLHDEDLAVWISLRQFNLTLTHGLSRHSPFGVMIFGVLMVSFGSLGRAAHLGKQALTLSTKMEDDRLSYKLDFLFDSLIRHWKQGLRAEPDLLKQAFLSSSELGDSNFAEFSLATRLEHSFFAGDALANVQSICDEYIGFFKQVRGPEITSTFQGQSVLHYRQLIKALQGSTVAATSLTDGHFDEEAFISSLKEGAAEVVYHSGKSFLHYLFGEFEEGFQHAAYARKLLPHAVATVYVREVNLLHALCLASCYDDAPPYKRIAYLIALYRAQRKFRRWSQVGPHNSRAPYELIRAEIARLRGRSLRAETLYDRAIDAAALHDRDPLAAVSNERAARHYLEQDRPGTARRFLVDALSIYQRWGAACKVHALEHEFADLLRDDRHSAWIPFQAVDPNDPDLTALIDASQLLSGEIRPGPLLTSLMEIVLKNAGADRGFLILDREGELFVEAELTFTEDPSARRLNEHLDRRSDLARSVVNYVAQMHEHVLIHDANHDKLFRHDAYIETARPRSILCVPIIQQRKLEGILYLENSLTGDAFTDQQLEVLRIVCTQAAISIANARLYGNLSKAHAKLADHAQQLEKRVTERTAELQRQRDLAEAGRATIEEQTRRLRELDAFKSRFFANLSHEFRTPLTLIMGPLEDLLQTADASWQSVDSAELESMHRNSQRLLRLINQLLDLSKLEAGRLTLEAAPGDIVSFVEEIVRSFSGHAERKSLELLFDTRRPAVELYFDRDLMERVVFNVLSNAVKFTPPGGKIHVAVEERRGPKGEFTDIIVKDTGQGIPESELPLIFDRYHQVGRGKSGSWEGTGIGLSLAKELVDLHHGHISVVSEVGFGTTFTISVPKGRRHLTSSEMRTKKEATHVMPELAVDLKTYSPHRSAGERLVRESDGKIETVLVADDNADMRRYLKACLSPEYEVAEAANGIEALSAAREIVPDIVVSDVMMPEMDGYALCRAIKNDDVLNHIPVILLTAKATEDSKIEGFKTGADDYLFKPFNSKELQARIENLIEQRRKLRRRFSKEMLIQPSDIAATSADAAFLGRAQEVVEAHISETTFNVDAFADEMNMSVRQLQRKLGALTDETPNSFIRMIRLKRAAQLLERNAGTVSEIAFDVGFSYQSHFSKAFRDFFGQSPTEFVQARSTSL